MSRSSRSFALPLIKGLKGIKRFPSLETRAWYDNRALQINLPQHTLSQLISAYEDNRSAPELSINIKPLVAHEAAHWMDHVSTTWGRDLVASHAIAIDARRSLDEKRFPEVLAYYAKSRDLALPDYFLDAPDYEDVEFGKPWVYKLSCGLRFSTDGTPDPNVPVPFTQFWDFESGRLICRAPFSISAMLESSAMHFELASLRALMGQYSQSKKADLIVEKLNSIGEALYDRLYILYTTCAHMAANATGVSDPEIAYRFAYHVTQLALNMPSALFEQIKVREKLFDDSNERIEAMIKNSDRGFLFVLLFFLLKDSKESRIDRALDAAVQEISLPSLKIIESMVEGEMQTHSTMLPKIAESESLKWHLERGLRIFQMRGILGDRLDPLTLLQRTDVPPIRTKDCYFYTPTKYADGFCDHWGELEADFFKASNRIDGLVDACL